MVFFGDLPLVRNRPRLAGFTPKPHGVYPFIEESALIGQVPAGSILCFVLHRAVHSLVVNNNGPQLLQNSYVPSKRPIY